MAGRALAVKASWGEDGGEKSKRIDEKKVQEKRNRSVVRLGAGADRRPHGPRVCVRDRRTEGRRGWEAESRRKRGAP